MRHLWFTLLVPGFVLHGADPIVPETAVPITTDFSVKSPTVISGIAGQFMAVWSDFSNNVQSSISLDKGASWSVPTEVGTSSSYGAWVAGNASGFVVTWIYVPPGASSGLTYASFYDINSSTWSTPTQVSPDFGSSGGNVLPMACVGSSSEGFMIAWESNDLDGYHNWFSFSSDGVSWSTPARITNSISNNAGTRLAGYGHGFMATWSTDSAEVMASFSDDFGAHWSTPVVIASNIYLYTNVSISGNPQGFMAAWHNENNNANVSFSSNQGTTWSTPIIVGENILDSYCDISVASNNTGFVVAWHDDNDNAWARFSPHEGTLWSEPVEIVSDASVASVYNSFIGVGIYQDQCMFCWTEDTCNAMSSFSYIPNVASVTPQLTSSFLFKQITPNRPRSQLFR